MMGHNIRFEGVYGKLSLNYPVYPFLSRALQLSIEQTVKTLITLHECMMTYCIYLKDSLIINV